MIDSGLVPESSGSRLGLRETAIVFGLLFLVCFLSIGRDLWTPDEPREAEISREMWLAPSVVPTLNGIPFIEKPPLYYWTVAGVFELVGGPSALAARSVSAIASFLTLLIVYLWGRREFSTRVGLFAACGLATSAQFMISSHWVLIDPLLMLFTTVACWSGWELIRNRGGPRQAFVLYGALVLALWTKGLIGPVLLGSGMIVYLIWKRSFRPFLAVYPIVGAAVLLGATALFAYLVYLEAGYSAVREWFWVNHVLRFTAPTYTGHEQPFYYYLYNIPVAALPWWVPFVDVFRRRRWREGELPNPELRIYLASLCIGMALILSASSTKRAIYLLPMLPVLALLLSVHAEAWLRRRGPESVRTWPWWIQVGLVTAFAAVPAAIGIVYLMDPDPIAVGFLILLALIVAVVVALSRKQRREGAVVALGVSAVAGVLGLLAVVVHMAAPQKDMSAFVEWIDEQIPAGEVVYGFGRIDETFDGIVPFVTGRRVVALSAEDIDRVAPGYLVVQDGNAGATAPDMSPGYELLGDSIFGTQRYVAVWRRQDLGANR